VVQIQLSYRDFEEDWLERIALSENGNLYFAPTDYQSMGVTYVLGIVGRSKQL